jgi:hypothetical protein
MAELTEQVNHLDEQWEFRFRLHQRLAIVAAAVPVIFWPAVIDLN